MKKKNSLIIIIIVAHIFTMQAQYKHTVKINVLSLLFSTSQGSLERKIAPQSSLTLSAYKGSFTFISTTKLQGANLLYRYYINDEDNLSGFYPELGVSVYGKNEFGMNKYYYKYGPRGGLGFQFVKKLWVYDIGLGMATYLDKVDNYDENGNVIGRVWNIETNMKVNCSVGIRF